MQNQGGTICCFWLRVKETKSVFGCFHTYSSFTLVQISWWVCKLVACSLFSHTKKIQVNSKQTMWKSAYWPHGSGVKQQKYIQEECPMFILQLIVSRTAPYTSAVPWHIRTYSRLNSVQDFTGILTFAILSCSGTIFVINNLNVQMPALGIFQSILVVLASLVVKKKNRCDKYYEQDLQSRLNFYSVRLKMCHLAHEQFSHWYYSPMSMFHCVCEPGTL